MVPVAAELSAMVNGCLVQLIMLNMCIVLLIDVLRRFLMQGSHFTVEA